MNPTKRLSEPQYRMLQAARAAGPAGVEQPRTSGRASVQRLSAWHRTANSLAARGLARVERAGGDTFKVVAVFK